MCAPNPRLARSRSRIAAPWQLGLFLLALPTLSAPLRFEVTYPPEAFAGPFTGRVVLFLSKTDREPRLMDTYVRANPLFGADFTNVPPGRTLRVDDANALAYPVRPSRIEGGDYWVQAVLDRNLGGRAVATSPGNLYSDPVAVRLEGRRQVVRLSCAHVVPNPQPQETEWARWVRLPSACLTAFHGRPTVLQAVVHLPQAWKDEPDRRFPVLVRVEGFGAELGPFPAQPAEPVAGVPAIIVVPDANVPLGHCVFANSANNGPWGDALVREFLPEIERRFRGYGEREARFVNGHSSGGWAAFWLINAYPDFFGRAWASSPDPVDFRSWHGVDLYAEGANFFRDPAGQPRPNILMGGFWPVTFTQELSDRERVLRGEQLVSFEAVFSPRGPLGEPGRLWDRATGAIDPRVAAAWRSFDLGYQLRTRWQQLAPQLAGRLSITMGQSDNFTLAQPVRLLERDLRALGADVRIELLPGDHFTVVTSEVRNRQLAWLVEGFQRWAAERR